MSECGLTHTSADNSVFSSPISHITPTAGSQKTALKFSSVGLDCIIYDTDRLYMYSVLLD